MIRKTMRAAVMRAVGAPLQIESVPIPQIRPDQVLVKVEACGVCHTDLHAANGDWPIPPKLPLIPGHEAVGVIVETGRQVNTCHEGDRVGVAWLCSACGECEWCSTGWETLCPKAQYGGYSVDGGYAEYVAARAAYLARIPKPLSPAAAAPILCAGVTTYKGLCETEARPGEWVAIVGVGGLGHMAIQYAQALGLRVVATDVSADKLELARQLGVQVAVNGNDDNAVEQILDATGGAHGVLVTAPSPSAFRQAVAATRRHGTCVVLGLPPGDFSFPVFDVVLRRITIRGSLVGTRADMRDALALAATHNIHAHTETIPLERINEAFERLRRGTVQGRLVIDLNQAAQAKAS